MKWGMRFSSRRLQMAFRAHPFEIDDTFESTGVQEHRLVDETIAAIRCR